MEGPFFVLFVSFSFIHPRPFRHYFLQASGPNVSFPPAHTKNIFMPEMIGELDESGSLCILSCFFLTGGLERCIIHIELLSEQHGTEDTLELSVLPNANSFLTSNRSRNLLDCKNAVYSSLKLSFYCNAMHHFKVRFQYQKLSCMCRNLQTSLSLY